MGDEARCPTCAELMKIVRDLQARVADLERQLAAAKKNSSNSSKPPSSDITKPPKTKQAQRQRKKKRRIGGQQGHPRQESNLSVADADHVQDYYADQHPDHLHRDLVPAPGLEPKILFQYEFVETPVELTAHISYHASHLVPAAEGVR